MMAERDGRSCQTKIEMRGTCPFLNVYLWYLL